MERRRTPVRTPRLETARRQIAVRLIVQCLQGWRHGDPRLRQAVGTLERRRALRRQPWRQPLRPAQQPVSMLERIRRVEARLRAH